MPVTVLTDAQISHRRQMLEFMEAVARDGDKGRKVAAPGGDKFPEPVRFDHKSQEPSAPPPAPLSQ